MAKPNYRHAKLQKERARKTRQLEKQQRRSSRPPDETGPEAPNEAEPTSALPLAPPE